MSQNTTVLSALKNHQLTPLDALKRHGIMRLAARVGELKEMGYNIKTNRKEVNGKTFASYELIGEK